MSGPEVSLSMRLVVSAAYAPVVLRTQVEVGKEDSCQGGRERHDEGGQGEEAERVVCLRAEEGLHEVVDLDEAGACAKSMLSDARGRSKRAGRTER